MEVQHRLMQLDSLGFLTPAVRRFLLDENVPEASLTLLIEVTFNDFIRLLENPTKESVDCWIRRGERSVWPAVGVLKVRCAIEVDLDSYQLVRRRKPFDLKTPGSANPRNKRSEAELRKRARATSFGAGG
jgi:TAG lipase/lysophosphatidylethanolamine acyltransferase